MSDDYQYDIFISYRRPNPVGGWVKNHFYPLLVEWLSQAMPYEPKIFIDTEGIETADDWPLKLQQALLSSRCLVAVWSADYFRSAWCMAEWQSMAKREELLGYRTPGNPSGLVYPVIFFDGEHFPPEARRVQSRDLRKWSYPYPSFRETQGFIEFTEEVKNIAVEIWSIIERTPRWQSDWPVVTPNLTPQPVSVNLPRLQ